MKLAEFLAIVGPFVLGRRSHDETVRALYPEAQQTGMDAARLVIYANSYRAVGFEMLSNALPRTNDFLARRAPSSARADLLRRYFLVNPGTEFRYDQALQNLPGFIATVPELDAWPWLSELADFEYWESATRGAPDEPAPGAHAGPLRLASSLEIRDYRHDLIAWLSTAPEGAPDGEPIAENNVVLFWRDAELRVRRRRAALPQFLVLQAVDKGIPVTSAATSAVPADALVAALRAMHDAGVLVGDLGATGDQ